VWIATAGISLGVLYMSLHLSILFPALKMCTATTEISLSVCPYTWVFYSLPLKCVQLQLGSVWCMSLYLSILFPSLKNVYSHNWDQSQWMSLYLSILFPALKMCTATTEISLSVCPYTWVFYSLPLKCVQLQLGSVLVYIPILEYFIPCP
jgi:hypothetical protein